MFGIDDLMQCREENFMSCSPDALVDLRDIKIDAAKPAAQRTQDFLEQVKNPYLFKVGDVTVKVNYGGGKSLSESLVTLFGA